jgi:hypothetical protein
MEWRGNLGFVWFSLVDQRMLPVDQGRGSRDHVSSLGFAGHRIGNTPHPQPNPLN